MVSSSAVGRHGADERDIDSLRRRWRQRVEDSWLEGEMADFRANAEAAKGSHGGASCESIKSSIDQTSPRVDAIPIWPIRIGLPIPLMRQWRPVAGRHDLARR